MCNRDKMVCECVGITKGEIIDAVKGGATTYEAVEVETTAGSVCGSCIDEINEIISEVKDS